MSEGKAEGTELAIDEDNPPRISQDTYRVFDYLKEHHTLLIACISAIVAGISFFINFIAYLYQRLTLQGWNVDSRVVDFSVKGQLYYYIIVSFIYIASICGFNYLIAKMFARYYQNSASITYAKCVVRKMKKEYNQHIKHIAKFERQMKKERGALDQAEQELLDQITRRTEKNRYNRKKIHRLIRRLRRNVIKNILAGLLATAILWLIIIFIYQVAVLQLSWMLFPSWLVGFCAIALGAYIQARRANKELVPQRIRKVVDETWEKGFEETIMLWDKALEIAAKPYPRLTVKQLLSDGNLKRLAETAINLFCTLTFTIIVMGIVKTPLQREYWIYADEIKQYVVIYTNDDWYILKEAEIYGDKLVVNTLKERILNSNDITLEYRHFSEVKRITESGEQKNE